MICVSNIRMSYIDSKEAHNSVNCSRQISALRGHSALSPMIDALAKYRNEMDFLLLFIFCVTAVNVFCLI